MHDKINLLKHKLHMYQVNREQNISIDWELIKEITCIISDVLEVIAKDMPDKWSWFSSYLLLISKVLKSMCNQKESQ